MAGGINPGEILQTPYSVLCRRYDLGARLVRVRVEVRKGLSLECFQMARRPPQETIVHVRVCRP